MAVFATRQQFKQYLQQFQSTCQEHYQYDARLKQFNRDISLLHAAETINTLYQTCINLKLRPIQFTTQGSIKRLAAHSFGAYDFTPVTNSANNVLRGIIAIIILDGQIYKFKFGHLQASADSTMTGTKAFAIFSKTCKDLGIDLEKYACTNGEEVKAEIQSPMITNLVCSQRIEHVNHLDLHKAWPSCTCAQYPELEKAYKAISDKRIIDPLNGYFQSNKINYRFANLALAGVNGCNAKISQLANTLEQQNFEVLGINTDGIWYRDRLRKNRLYHDQNEGPGMHQWENDHQDCTWYALSDGQYFFIENGKFNVRARGFYSYELTKPRDQWDEQDFFKAMLTLVRYTWEPSYGLIVNKEDN